jgi:negative regulator of genetic competence, sporulation and motility
MKLSFHFLWFYSCLIGILSFSIQEMPNSLTPLLTESVIEDSNSHKKEHKEKECRKEEEENEQEENEEEDLSEDIELEEKPSESTQNLSATIGSFQKINFPKNNLLNKASNTTFNDFLQSYPPLYILFACLKIDC